MRELAAALVFALAGSAAAAALPAWQSLVYELRSFGVTARSELALDATAGGGMTLTATSSISNNSETVELSLGPGGELQQRTRFSSGRNQRFKAWDYRPGYVVRVRREPPRRGGGDPQGWAESSRQQVAYPEEREGRILTDPYALLLHGGWLLAGDAEMREVLVQTDRNYYLVELSRLPDDTAMDAAGSGLRGVRVQARPVGAQPDEPDFSLLGLDGELTLAYDDAGIPRLVSGRAPRIGATSVSLVEVSMREVNAGAADDGTPPSPARAADNTQPCGHRR